MAQQSGEVNEFIQKVAVDPSLEREEGDDIEDDEDESETQLPSSGNKKESDEDEDESEEEGDEPEDTEEDTENPDPAAEELVKAEPKPVEGETPRERALRLETTRLKGLLRKERQDELFIKKPQQGFKPTEDDEELSQYDPEELKRFELLATKMGFMKKDELVQQTAQEKNNSEFDSFMEAHPEYSPENDPDGLLWDQFKSEFNLYQPPQDPKTLRKVLNKVHSELHGVQPAKNLSKINASREKIKVASHRGGSGNRTTRAPAQTIPNGLRTDGMKGFTADEIADIFS